MTDLSRDILAGILFFAGIACFISGAFVFSAASFAAAAMFGNMSNRSELENL